MPRYALFVTGPPATGKSSVAEALLRTLPHFALLQKDLLKEALFDAMRAHEPGSVPVSRRLSRISMHLLWTIAGACPRVILEANFCTSDPEQRERFQALDANKLEVHCSCPPGLAMRRFADRADSRHPAHTPRPLRPRSTRSPRPHSRSPH